MTKTPRINLFLTPQSETGKSFKAFRTELAGDEKTSNMMIIDSEIGGLSDRCDTLDASVNGLSDRCDNLDANVNGLSDRCDTLDASVNGLSDRCDNLDASGVSWGMLKNGFGWTG